MAYNEQKLGFRCGTGAISNSMAPRIYALAEILRTPPDILHALALMQGDGAHCSVGKGFTSIAFTGLAGVAGAQEVAKAEYIAQALNAMRPKGMFEQIASVRGASVSMDVSLLRKLLQHLHAEHALSAKAHAAQNASHVADMLALIDNRRAQAEPIHEGFYEHAPKGQRARASTPS